MLKMWIYVSWLNDILLAKCEKWILNGWPEAFNRSLQPYHHQRFQFAFMATVDRISWFCYLSASVHSYELVEIIAISEINSYRLYINAITVLTHWFPATYAENHWVQHKSITQAYGGNGKSFYCDSPYFKNPRFHIEMAFIHLRLGLCWTGSLVTRAAEMVFEEGGEEDAEIKNGFVILEEPCIIIQCKKA